MELIEYDIIEFEHISKGRKSIYIIAFILGYIISITIIPLICVQILPNFIGFLLGVIILLPTLYLVNKLFYNKTNQFNIKGSFVITKQGIEVHFVEKKIYLFSELKRIYYKFDRAEFDFENKYPRALSYKLVIIDNSEFKNTVRILRKNNKNSLLPNIKNDLETILETLRKINYKIYQTIRCGD